MTFFIHYNEHRSTSSAFPQIPYTATKSSRISALSVYGIWGRKVLRDKDKGFRALLQVVNREEDSTLSTIGCAESHEKSRSWHCYIHMCLLWIGESQAQQYLLHMTYILDDENCRPWCTPNNFSFENLSKTTGFLSFEQKMFLKLQFWTGWNNGFADNTPTAAETCCRNIVFSIIKQIAATVCGIQLKLQSETLLICGGRKWNNGNFYFFFF
jgi:hypothetical protein